MRQTTSTIKTFYRPIEVAIRWTGLLRYESAILECIPSPRKLPSSLVCPRHHPQVAISPPSEPARPALARQPVTSPVLATNDEPQEIPDQTVTSQEDSTDTTSTLLQDHIVSPAQTTERLQSIQKLIAEQLGEESPPDFESNVLQSIPVQAGGLYPISDVWSSHSGCARISPNLHGKLQTKFLCLTASTIVMTALDLSATFTRKNHPRRLSWL